MVDLKDVTCIQLIADRRSDSQGGVAEVVTSEESADVEFNVHPVHWGKVIEVWFRASVETPNARLAAAFAIQYERTGDEEIPESVRVEFVERVAVMAVLPYLRLAIQGLGMQLGVPAPLLPILRQGEFRVSISDVEDGEAGADS